MKEVRKDEKDGEANKEAGGRGAVVSPHCVRVHDPNGRLVKGRRWVTG